MKIIYIFFICVLNYFLQTSFLPMFSILPVVPNTNLLVVLFSGIFFGNYGGALVGLGVGLLQDMIFSHTMGMHGLVLFMLGFSSGYLKEYFSEGHTFAVIPFIAAGAVMYHFFYYLICYFFASDVLLSEFIRNKLIWELVADIVLGLPSFLLFRKLFAIKTLSFTD